MGVELCPTIGIFLMIWKSNLAPSGTKSVIIQIAEVLSHCSKRRILGILVLVRGRVVFLAPCSVVELLNPASTDSVSSVLEPTIVVLVETMPGRAPDASSFPRVDVCQGLAAGESSKMPFI